MMDTTSEARLQLINPVLADKIRALAVNLSAAGLEIRVVQGLRSWATQDALFAQGRDANGNVIDKSKVVTNARGGYSWHNFGLAVDCAPDNPNIPGFQIDWNAGHPQWKQMEAAGVALGLTSGANWLRLVDAPHFQLTGRFPVTPDDEVRQLFKDGGMEAVWNEAGIIGGQQ